METCIVWWSMAALRVRQKRLGHGLLAPRPDRRSGAGLSSIPTTEQHRPGVDFSKKGQADYAGAKFGDLVDAIAHFDAQELIDPKKVGVTGGLWWLRLRLRRPGSPSTSPRASCLSASPIRSRRARPTSPTRCSSFTRAAGHGSTGTGSSGHPLRGASAHPHPNHAWRAGHPRAPEPVPGEALPLPQARRQDPSPPGALPQRRAREPQSSRALTTASGSSAGSSTTSPARGSRRPPPGPGKALNPSLLRSAKR